MNVQNGMIPIVIGITGHRDPRQEDLEALRSSVSDVYRRIRENYPDAPLFVMSSVAAGADQLCAEVALESGIGVISVLPMPVEEYRKDFDGDDAVRFDRILSASQDCFVSLDMEGFSPNHGPSDPRARDYLYRQAGLYIVSHSHILLALWDGKEGSADGCGCASIVRVASEGLRRVTTGSQLQTARTPVLQIVTPRRSSPDAALTAGEMIFHGDRSATEKILEYTNTFDRDCCIDAKTSPAPDTESVPDPVMNRLLSIYNTSDKLSVANAGKYRNLLVMLSVFASVLTMAFLLYDEMELAWMIVVCGFMICALFLVNAVSRQSQTFDHYLEYRMLAESTRVQTYLRSAGISCEVAEIMPWSIQATIPWVKYAVSVAMIGGQAGTRVSILDPWVTGQKDYHIRALERTSAKMDHNNRIVRIALILTIATYIATLVFEIIWGGLFSGKALLDADTLNLFRFYVKVVLGTLSAITIFTGNYYGKQALPDVIDGHRNMILLYEEAERQIMQNGESEPFLIRLAENELAENSNWYAYQSTQGLDLGIS